MEENVFKHNAKEKREIVKGEGSSPNGEDSSLHTEVSDKEIFVRKVRKIIKIISEKNDFPFVNNFYAESNEKQANLENYFHALYGIKPKFMFIGEAPGIHGCALTGIPFTSERLIKQKRLDRHFPGTKFVVNGNTYEGSAGYFWEMIDLMPKPPVLWNVFPLHPYKIEKDKNGKDIIKNRPPKKEEIEWGGKILRLVLDLFPGIQIITVGNHAKKTCEKLGIETYGHIIHPAYHPKEFRIQFHKLILNP
jgi:hypothetical protein